MWSRFQHLSFIVSNIFDEIFDCIVSIDIMGGFDFLGVCIRNCAQCKKMFGSYFEGERCADACVKFKGKIIPDCEDIASIAPFLNKIDA